MKFCGHGGFDKLSPNGLLRSSGLNTSYLDYR